MIEGVVAIVGALALTTGLVLASVGLLGMFRKPEIFEQLHAAGLVTGPGVILVLLASLATGRAETITSAILVIAFVLVTASLSTHVIADAAWRRRSLLAGRRAGADRAPDEGALAVSGGEAGTARTGGSRRIVVAYDGSPGAETAGALAARLAWPPDSTIELVAVPEADLPALSQRAAEAGAASRTTDAHELDRGLRAIAGQIGRSGASVEWRRLAGDPAGAIVEHARAVGADLIITGSRGLGHRTLLLGSVAQEVIDRAPCPVLVARSDAVKTVLLAVDGSAASALAIDLVAGWTIFERAAIRVLSVATDEPAYTGRSGTDPMSGARGRSDHQRIADEATARLIGAGRRALPSVATGDATTRIAAEARSVDLVVIGSRGRTGLTRALLGSVAQGVLLSTQTSVLVVRRNAATSAEDA